MPELPARFLRVSGALLFGLAGIVALGVASDDTDPAPVWQTVVALAAAACLLVAAVRCARIGLVADHGTVVIRNVTRTHRVPITEVLRFAEDWSAWHQGPTLTVVTNKRGIAVMAYPITLLPQVALRRRATIELLNDWLASQR